MQPLSSSQKGESERDRERGRDRKGGKEVGRKAKRIVAWLEVARQVCLILRRFT